MKSFNRRAVLVGGGLALAHGSVAATGSLQTALASAGGEPESAPPAVAVASLVADDVWSSFPSTDPDLVRAIVGAAHTDVDTVSQLVTTYPHLSRAAIDWGFGDWESALGAASHMGRRDIADALLEAGARPDIFSAAMLGQVEVVQGFVVAMPGIQSIQGPHGFTLLAHARAGGEEAAGVVAYLEDLGGADVRPETAEMSEAERALFVGTYGFTADTNAYVEIEDRNGGLSFKRAGAPFGRRLFPVSGREFFPSGSPAVRIAFDVEGDRAIALRVIDSVEVLVATRA